MEYENEMAEVDESIRIGDYRFPKVLREHVDLLMEGKRKIIPKQEPLITEGKVLACLSKLKAKKATGPDGIKPELYKVLMKRKACIEVLVRCYNKELEIKGKPESWKKSRTKMIGKKRKPRAKDLRPINLLNILYKVFMVLINDEIEARHRLNEEDHECQARFTGGSRIEDNILTLQYL
ncbi:uncharacterized protein LOC135200744 [Macrobrachium nipponense]|uniref:uncharacterized protein LOC135200744 n=1 Tax=Macrobrachium nipponense TaxID=159736 RepID=UPI0030C7BCB6